MKQAKVGEQRVSIGACMQFVGRSSQKIGVAASSVCKTQRLPQSLSACVWCQPAYVLFARRSSSNSSCWPAKEQEGHQQQPVLQGPAQGNPCQRPPSRRSCGFLRCVYACV